MNSHLYYCPNLLTEHLPCSRDIQWWANQSRTPSSWGLQTRARDMEWPNLTITFSTLWSLTYISYFTLTIDYIFYFLHICLLCPTRFKIFIKKKRRYSHWPLLHSRYCDILLSHVISNLHNNPLILALSTSFDHLFISSSFVLIS